MTRGSLNLTNLWSLKPTSLAWTLESGHCVSGQNTRSRMLRACTMCGHFNKLSHIEILLEVSDCRVLFRAGSPGTVEISTDNMIAVSCYNILH